MRIILYLDFLLITTFCCFCVDPSLDESKRAIMFIKSLSQSSPFQEDFKITVYRQYPGDKCTSGYLAVNDKIICYTLEKPWKDNKKNISAIPAGKYGAILRYDHTDHWRIELTGVVGGRTHIQIHIGNTVDDISGCILVGDKLSVDLCSLKGGSSAPAFNRLRTAFYGTENPTSSPNKNITVEIVGDQKAQ